MPFEKGKVKTGGRVKGVINKTTPEIRDAIQKVVSAKIDELESDLSMMNPFQQWVILEKVSKYFMPALNKNEDTVEHSGEVKVTVSFVDAAPVRDNDSADEDFSF